MNVAWSCKTDKYAFVEASQHYQIIDNHIGTICQAVMTLVHNTLALQKGKVDARFSICAPDEKLAIKVKFGNSLEFVYNHSLNQINDPELNDIINGFVDYNSEQKRICLTEAKKLAETCLNTIPEKDRTIPSPAEFPEIFSTWHLFFHHYMDRFWAENGDKPIKIDRIQLGLFELDPLSQDCGTLTFSLLKDHNFINYYLQHGTPPQEIYTSKYRELLTGWKYAPVELPQNNDLVVYEKDQVAKHYAIYKGNDHVLSKKGNFAQTIFIHHITNVGSNYGNTFIFFRKKESK